MTPGPTSVDIQGMTQAQQDFQQALDQINSVYNAMSEERDTLAGNWAGEAASAFGQALGAWLDDLFTVQQELVIMTESLSTHTGIYANATETSNDVANAFHQGLSGLDGLPDPMGPHPATLLATQPGTVPLQPALRMAALPETAALPATPTVPLQPTLRMDALPETAVLPATLAVPLQPEV